MYVPNLLRIGDIFRTSYYFYTVSWLLKVRKKSMETAIYRVSFIQNINITLSTTRYPITFCPALLPCIRLPSIIVYVRVFFSFPLLYVYTYLFFTVHVVDVIVVVVVNELIIALSCVHCKLYEGIRKIRRRHVVYIAKKNHLALVIIIIIIIVISTTIRSPLQI